MKIAGPLRFYFVLGLHPAYALIVLACVAAVGLWTVVLSPREAGSGLGMILFVQMFLASSGFVPAARRGHFDPILIGRSRTSAVAWHWVVSVLPGAMAWLGIATAAIALGNTSARSALVGSSAAAFFIVSTVAWAAGFWLARGAAGMLWIGILVVLLIRHVTLVPAGAAASLSGVIGRAATLVVCPILLVDPPRAVEASAIAVAVAFAGALLASVWRFAHRVDIPLQGGV